MSQHITIKDIAREAGVSISLVSFVMNNRIGADGKRKYRVSEDTRDRVLEVARRLNYKPNSAARNLRQGRSHVIGVILSDMSNIFYGVIARQFEELAFQKGYTVLFGSSDENAEKFSTLVQSFLDKAVEGFIVVPCTGSEDTMKMLQNTGIPLVVIDRHQEGIHVPNVYTDNADAMDQALNHLMGQGAKNIAMVSYAMRISSMTDREERFSSFLREKGVEHPEGHIYHLSFDMKPEEIRRVAELLVVGKFDGVVFASNVLAVSVLKLLHRRGIAVMKDVKVVSFDFSNVYGFFQPAIPYIQQPVPEMSAVVANILFSLIEDRQAGRDISGRREVLTYKGTLVRDEA